MSFNLNCRGLLLSLMGSVVASVTIDAASSENIMSNTMPRNEKQITVKSDKGYNLGSLTTYQGYIKEKAKKTITLSDLPKSIWSQYPNAAISVLGYCADNKNNGIDEALDVIVNGHINRFKINSFFGRGYENMRWSDFPIPKEQLKAGENTIVICKSQDSKDDDDYFYIGISAQQQNHCSYYSENNGQTWGESLNSLSTKGEYMVRIKLYEGERPPIAVPVFDRLPSVKPIITPFAPAPSVCLKTSTDITLQNDYIKIKFLTGQNKLHLREFKHKILNIAFVDNEFPGQFFKIRKGDKNLTSDNFILKQVEASSINGQSEISFQMEEAAANPQLAATLTVGLGSSSEMAWNFSVKNIASEPIEAFVIFPVIQGIRWSEDPASDYYFFPGNGGMISLLPQANIASYGGNAFFQVMASYLPDAGGGLSVSINDSKGLYKTFGCVKNTPGSLMRGEILRGDIRDKLDTDVMEYLYSELFSDVPGTSLSVAYQPELLVPGQAVTAPGAIIDAMTGDWHTPMNKYVQWFRGKSFKHKVAGRLNGYFNASGVWLSQNSYRETLDPTLQMPELFAWWEWEKVTPDLTTRNNLQAQKVNRSWTLRTDYCRGEDGVQYFFGNNGDYGKKGYNERWGGLPALRGYIKKLQKENRLVTMYLTSVLLEMSSEPGREHGEQWGIVGPDRKYLWDYVTWGMCHDNPLWREFLVDTVMDMIKKSDCDGIRLDELGCNGSRCLNNLHRHTFGKNREFAWFQAMAATSRQTREKIDAIKPRIYLMTEFFGYDHMAQYIDGCLSYLLPPDASATDLYVNFPRFYFPECKQYEYYYKKDPAAEKKLIFNGLGWSGRLYSAKALKFMTENADAFDSLDVEPLIPTFMRQIYVNRFSSKNKTLYTVYNTNPVTVEGFLCSIPLNDTEHVFDTYNLNEIPVRRNNSSADIYISLGSGGLACPTVLKKSFAISVVEQQTVVTLTEAAIADEIVVVDVDGKEIYKAKICSKSSTLNDFAKGIQKNKIFYKILKKGILVDMAEQCISR